MIMGLALAAGALLMSSTWLWPRSGTGAAARHTSRIRSQLNQAGMERVPSSLFIIVSVLIGVATGGLVAAITPVVALPAAAGIVAAWAPLIVVTGRARRRRRVLRAAWPDLVDHLVAGIRSGRSLADAVAALAEVGPFEIRGAFRDFARLVRTTDTLGIALDSLKERLSDPVADRIVETIRMAKEVGGTELPSILRALGAALRHEAALRAEIEARQSWVLNAARLGVASPWIVLALLASRPEGATAYNSPAGFTLLVVGFAVSVVAYRVMVALGRLPDERRTFA